MKQNIFLSQLKEDISVIQKQWVNEDTKLKQDWYAFNYWILNYLYHIDIENCEEYITEFKDKGIDCFVHYEDTKELYIIQNTFCDTNHSIKRDHFSDFLTSPLISLSEKTFTRSKVLQDIFDSIKDDNEYTIYLYYYITKPKDSISTDIRVLFNTLDYSAYEFEVVPKLITLDDIINIYEGNRFIEKINFEFTITLQKKYMIDIKSEQSDKNKNVNTAYFAINVYELYKMFVASEKSGYDLFDDNIREYLGLKGKRGKINKEIFNTLIDSEERSHFFYYNNGITMICHKYISPTKSHRYFTITQPKIVNGCQTMNTITSAIEYFFKKGEAEKEIVRDFKHCTILVKVYEVNKDNDYENHIYKNIVKNTNSQTSISSKDFASKNTFFLTLQNDFLKRGFYLIVRQSDQYTYDKDDELFLKNKRISKELCERLNINVNTPKDLYIDLSKMLKALMAFYFDGYTAFKKSKYLLNETSDEFYRGFSKNLTNLFSTNNMINIYLLYVRCGGLIPGRKDRDQIPYYILDFFGRFAKSKEYDYEYTNHKLDWLFSKKEIFDEVYQKITEMVEDYAEKFMENNSVDYSTMTKNREMDIDLINELIRTTKKEAKRHNLKYLSQYIES